MSALARDFSRNYFQNRVHQSGVQLKGGALFLNPLWWRSNIGGAQRFYGISEKEK